MCVYRKEGEEEREEGYKEKFILDFIFNATRNVRRGRLLLPGG